MIIIHWPTLDKKNKGIHAGKKPSIHLVEPSVSVRLHEDTPPFWRRRAATELVAVSEILAQSYVHW